MFCWIMSFWKMIMILFNRVALRGGKGSTQIRTRCEVFEQLSHYNASSGEGAKELKINPLLVNYQATSFWEILLKLFNTEALVKSFHLKQDKVCTTHCEV